MTGSPRLRVGIVGAGMAGLACAQALAMSGAMVQLVDKGRGPGGRLATRRVPWADDANVVLGLDHGAQILYPRSEAFGAWLKWGETQGWAAPWAPRPGDPWASAKASAGALAPPAPRTGWVGVPGMSALAQAMRRDLSVASGQAVVAIERAGDAAWSLRDAQGMVFGPFDHVVVAVPPAQAAPLLAPFQPEWAQRLRAVAMLPCWTLLAVSDDTPTGWDVLQPETGPLAWVARNHRKPGRVVPAGVATWVAQAGAAWTAAHVDDDAATVQQALAGALQALLAPAGPQRWQHLAVHRWLYALAPTDPAAPPAQPPCWWDAAAGLGVCGDHLAGNDVEAAWASGRALARCVVVPPRPAG